MNRSSLKLKDSQKNKFRIAEDRPLQMPEK